MPTQERVREVTRYHITQALGPHLGIEAGYVADK